MKNLITISFISLFIFSCGDPNCVEGDCTNGFGKKVTEFIVYEGNFERGQYSGEGNLYDKEYDMYFIGEFMWGCFWSGKVIFSDGRIFDTPLYMVENASLRLVNEWGREEIMTHPDGTIQKGYWEIKKIDTDSDKWGLYFNGEFQEILDWYKKHCEED